MQRTKKTKTKLSSQIKKSVNKKPKKKQEYDGSTEAIVSTGSLLLDLAITGGRIRGGGIPSGILVEAFGPNSSGKTVLLTELAGAVQRQGGDVMFHDPEARLNKQFAKLFDLDTDDMDYQTPDTIPQLFQAVRKWEPEEPKKINGIFADSLAALSTDLEMEKEEGDKMGMRRAKEFSEELRRTCRVLKQRNLLMVCSNQVRQSQDTYGPKYTSPGGEAIGFYSSLRLRFFKPEKIKKKKNVHGKEVTKVIGIQTQVEVFKSSVWEPYHAAPLTILFDYGIDSIRDELQFIKNYSKNTTYTVGGQPLDKSMDKAIQMVEADPDLLKALREEVIDLWEELEEKFKVERKPKQRG